MERFRRCSCAFVRIVLRRKCGFRSHAVSGGSLRFPIPKLGNDLFLRAVNHLPVPRVPVWLMRQAGRADPAYAAYRERAGLPLRALFRSAEHAVPISLLPRRFGVDAIVLYQDILTPLAPMGADFDFRPGPILELPIRHADQVRALQPVDPVRDLAFVAESIRGVRAAMQDELPLIGFAGAPFTLAAFLIRGSSPLSGMHVAYLRFQIAAGAHAVQLFESVGDQIPAPEYERYAHPSHQRILAALPADVPAILFVKGSPDVDRMLASGAAVVSVGERASLGDVLRRGGGRVAVQGNVNNRILAEGSGDDVEAAVISCVADSGGRGHILNLNHGLLPETPFENVRRFVNAAKKIALEPVGRSG